MNSQEAWLQEQENITKLEKEQPELIECKKKRAESDIFQEIGIWNMPANRPEGYLRRFYSDFIVEEKTQENTVIRVNEIIKGLKNEKTAEANLLTANLIKIGITTNIAVERLIKAFGLKGNIGYAGLKDEEAITGQQITFPKIKMPFEEIENTKILNILLTNFYYGSKSLRPGYLEGNEFTIAVRTKEKINEQRLLVKLETLEKFGFLNYFQSQRFGGIRLDSHQIGKLIMQGRYELAVRYLLFKTNEYEMSLIAQLKKQAEKLYPEYSEIIKIFEKLPYSFFQELTVLKYLENNLADYVGALLEIKDSITICIYAYSSLLFNKYLSLYSKERGCTNETFPLLLSNDRADHKIYQSFLIEDKTDNFLENLKPLRHIYFKPRQLAARIFLKNINYKLFNGGVVINFFLPKGAYATTFLSNIFELHEGAPVPEWVSDNEIDVKEMLGQGSLEELKTIFKNSWK